MRAASCAGLTPGAGLTPMTFGRIAAASGFAARDAAT